MYTDPSIAMPAASDLQGLKFRREDAAFKAVKSTALGFATGAGIMYAIAKFISGVESHHWTLKPMPYDLGIAAVSGILTGALWGYGTLKETQVYNHRADVLNRYSNRPEVMQDILAQTGGPAPFYERTRLEKLMGSANTVSLFGWFGSAALQNRSVSNFFAATSALTAFSWLTAHIAGINTWERGDRKTMNFAERIANERTIRQATSPSIAL